MTEAEDILSKKERDELDNARTEIQKLRDRIDVLELKDEKNFAQHGQILSAVATVSTSLEKVSAKLDPIATTYGDVNRLGKWLMALLVFLSVLGGVLFTWGRVIKGG